MYIFSRTAHERLLEHMPINIRCMANPSKYSDEL